MDAGASSGTEVCAIHATARSACVALASRDGQIQEDAKCMHSSKAVEAMAVRQCEVQKRTKEGSNPPGMSLTRRLEAEMARGRRFNQHRGKDKPLALLKIWLPFLCHASHASCKCSPRASVAFSGRRSVGFLPKGTIAAACLSRAHQPAQAAVFARSGTIAEPETCFVSAVSRSRLRSQRKTCRLPHKYGLKKQSYTVSSKKSAGSEVA